MRKGSGYMDKNGTIGSVRQVGSANGDVFGQHNILNRDMMKINEENESYYQMS
jgi:hypothetical protein